MPIGVEELLLAAEREDGKMDDLVRRRDLSATAAAAAAGVEVSRNRDVACGEDESRAIVASARKKEDDGSASTMSSGEDLLRPKEDKKEKKKKRVLLAEHHQRENFNDKGSSEENREENFKKRKVNDQGHHRSSLRKKLGSFSDVDISEPASSVTNSNLLSGSGTGESGESDPTSKEEESDMKQKTNYPEPEPRSEEDLTSQKGQKQDNHHTQYKRHRGHHSHPKKLQLKHLYSKNKKYKRGGGHGQDAPKEVTTQKSPEPISSVSASGRSSSSSEENSISSQQAVYHFSTNRSDDDSNESEKDNREKNKDTKKRENKNQKKVAMPEQIKFPVNAENEDTMPLTCATTNASMKKKKKKKKDKKLEDTRGSNCKTSGSEPNSAAAVGTTSHSSSTTTNPEKPKRPLSAYNYFFRDERARILQERSDVHRCAVNTNGGGQKMSGVTDESPNPLEGKESSNNDGKHGSKKPVPHRKISFENLGKLIAERWKNLSSEDRSQYQEMAQKDANRYRQEMDDYYERENTKRRAMYFPELAQDAFTSGGASSDDVVSSLETSGVSAPPQVDKDNSKNEAKKLKREAFEVMAARKSDETKKLGSDISRNTESLSLPLQSRASTNFSNQASGSMSTAADKKPPAESSIITNATFDQNQRNSQQQEVVLNGAVYQQLQKIQSLLNQIANLQKNQNQSLSLGQVINQQAQNQNVAKPRSAPQAKQPGPGSILFDPQQHPQKHTSYPQQQNQVVDPSKSIMNGNTMTNVQATNSQRPINSINQNASFQNTTSPSIDVNQMILQLLPAILPALQQQNANQHQLSTPQQQLLTQPQQLLTSQQQLGLQQFHQGRRVQHGAMNQAKAVSSSIAPAPATAQASLAPFAPPLKQTQTINSAPGFSASQQNAVNQTNLMRLNLLSSQAATQGAPAQQLSGGPSGITSQAVAGGSMNSFNNGVQNPNNSSQINQLLMQLFASGGQGGTK